MTKRIIGLPGETVSFYDGNVYINDTLFEEDYLEESVATYALNHDYWVPDGCYFMMGDNRMDSKDSRFWNNPYVAKSFIKGKWLGTLVHFNR